MVMHDAYSAIRKAWPAWHGWLTAFFVALFMLPGTVLVAGTAHSAQDLLVIALACLIPAGMLMALCLGARQLLKAVFGIQEPFNFFAAAAMLAAAALAYGGLFVIPAYMQRFASFGANLPEPTLFLLEYHYLLLPPAVLLPFAVFRLRTHPRREDYFAAILAGEFFVLLMCFASLYVVVYREAVVAG